MSVLYWRIDTAGVDSPSPAALLAELCSRRGWQLTLLHPPGRKRLDMPVQNFLDAYRSYGSFAAAARAAGCSRGTVRRKLLDTGLIHQRRAGLKDEDAQ